MANTKRPGRVTAAGEPFSTRKKKFCFHCGNNIVPGQKCVAFRKVINGERVRLYVHYPNCFDELGGRLRVGKDTVFRSCTPMWVRLGWTEKKFMALKKRIRFWKRTHPGRY